MLKIKLQGTTKDIKWFWKMLERDNGEEDYLSSFAAVEGKRKDYSALCRGTSG